MTYFGSVYGQIELKERPPIITREQEKDIANKLTQGIRDYLTSEEAFEAQARFTAEKLWEGLFEWANQACPHQFYANTKQQCPACWDELRDSIYGKQARQEDKGGEMNIYLKAWKLLLERLERKTGWGKEEIKKLMLQCLLDAGEEEK